MSGMHPVERMSVLVVDGEGAWARLLALARAGLPKRFRALIAGPATRLELSFSGNRLGTSGPKRLVDAVIANDLVLRATLRLPRAARASIASAARLHALERTPFSDGDLLCHVTSRRDPDDADMLLCSAVYVPRRYIDRGLLEHGVTPAQLRRLIIDETSETAIDLLAAYAPRVHRRRVLATAVPLILLALAATTGWTRAYVSERADLDRLSAEMALAEDNLGALARSLAAEKKDRLASDALLASMPGADRSITTWLTSLNAALSLRLEVRRLSISGAIVELGAASPDLLADVRALSAALGGFKVEIIGTVASEGAGLQSATVRLTALSEPAGR